MREYFIKATESYNTFDAWVPAHYFRRAFHLGESLALHITVAACGFYELYFNGRRITRGLLSPYISNTDDYIYFDEYDVTADAGENVIGLLLGNGFQNNPGGHIWEFDKAPFRSAPMAAVTVRDGGEILLTSGEGFKIAPSPILFDDYRFGEYYDARREIRDWCCKGFDDTAWAPALLATPPKGELRKADIAPIVKECEREPVSITPCGEGFIYDFGQSNAGLCRLRLCAEAGRKITLRYADSLLPDGDLNLAQVWFEREMWERDKHIVHLDTYVCKGDGEELYEPSFTYHGFRYVRVDGITAAEATPRLLTYLVYHTRLHSRGDFSCSHPVADTLQRITRRSLVSNFHHFPTDCPQREKNGWTADAALSSETMLLNYDPEQNYRQWHANIRKAQSAEGSLPGIVPTGGWGFEWGNGPAWDCVLVYLPYYVYLYRGETDMITESVSNFLNYLGYLRRRCDEKGLLAIGLGDWCHAGRAAEDPKAPLTLTDSVMAMDIAAKTAHMLGAVGLTAEQAYAQREADAYRAAIRAHMIDFTTMRAVGSCQSSQAMCLWYGVFEKEEEQAAFEALLGFVREADDHLDVGVLGARVLFHVLARFGYGDLAFKMITREDFPSYGNWLKRGATTLWEVFLPDRVSSMNHHFWGDISAWFIKRVAGIELNPTGHDVREAQVHPRFLVELEHASAWHESPAGKIAVTWERRGNEISLRVETPDTMHGTIVLDRGYRFRDINAAARELASGTYTVTEGT